MVEVERRLPLRFYYVRSSAPQFRCVGADQRLFLKRIWISSQSIHATVLYDVRKYIQSISYKRAELIIPNN
jgi:hypothetical protein